MATTTTTVPSEELLQDVVRRIVEVANPEKIILFGSAAAGRMGPNSDLDLLIIKDGSYNQGQLTEEIYFSLRALSYAKDIILVTSEHVARYKDCPALIVYPALREGRSIYERPAV